MPCSVTTQCTWARVVTTPAPGLRIGTIRVSPLLVVAGRAMIGLPPGDSEAPRMKSIWPPTPEYMRVPIESAQIWPVRSTSIALLIAVTLGFLRITAGSLTYATSSITICRLSSMKS
jgi:hypothetical protein